MTKTTTMSREEVECGYCKRVQTNRGGNLGYNCKKHRKSGMSITKITLYTEEQLKEKLTSRDNEWRERMRNDEELKELLLNPLHASVRNRLEEILKI